MKFTAMLIWNRSTLTVFLLILLLNACSKSSDPMDPPTMEGTWSGVVNHTYYCEASSETVQFDITGNQITFTGGNLNFTTGTISRVADNNYSIVFSDGINDVTGLIYTEPSLEYAVVSFFTGANQGYVGILQKGALGDNTYTEADLIGNWQGTTINLDSNLGVVNISNSNGSITDNSGLALSGTDGDGVFSTPNQPGIILEGGFEPFGVYVSGWSTASQVQWGNTLYDALYFLSGDKQTLVAAFMSSVCSTTVFIDAPSPKLAIWRK